jgi:hypothetical protein
MRFILDRAPEDMDEQDFWIRYPSFLDFVRTSLVVSLLGQSLDDCRAVHIR